MQSTRTQRTDADALESLGAERAVETQRHRAGARRTQREQEANRATLEPASRELEHAGRGTVEPLDVVHRDDESVAAELKRWGPIVRASGATAD